MGIDWDKVKQKLGYIALADHMGDVNNGLPDLAQALGFRAAYSGRLERTVFEWEEACSGCGYGPEDLKYTGGECDYLDGIYKPVNLVDEAGSW